MNSDLQKAVAYLGRRMGAAKRRGHTYVPMDLEIAKVIHKALASQVKAEYLKQYRKL